MRKWKRSSIVVVSVLIACVAIVVWWLRSDKPSHDYVATYEYFLETDDPISFELEVKALTDIQVDVFGPGDLSSTRLEAEESVTIHVERDEGLMTCSFNNQTVSFEGLSHDEEIGFPWLKSGDLVYWVEGEDGAALAGNKVSAD